jgi:hypothetical protein
MKLAVSHSFEEETPEAKCRWFMQKPVDVRVKELFCEMTFFEKLRLVDPPDDRSSFKTFRLLERRKS